MERRPPDLLSLLYVFGGIVACAGAVLAGRAHAVIRWESSSTVRFYDQLSTVLGGLGGLLFILAAWLHVKR